MIEFELQGQEFIELNKLLKLLGLVRTGGEANLFIERREVSVNGQIETRKRNKIRAGDLILFQGKTISIR